MTVLNLMPINFAVLERIEAADKMPCKQPCRGRLREEVLRIQTVETHVRVVRRLEVRRQIAVHPIAVIRFVDRHVMQHAVRVMQRNVERRKADKSGKQWQAMASVAALVELLPKLGQNDLHTCVADLDRMSPGIKLGPGRG